jgi:hypothetical protein
MVPSWKLNNPNSGLMKKISLMLCVSIICSIAGAEDVIVDRLRFGGDAHMDFRVPRDELRKVRPWEPGAGTDAPLTRDQALEIARKAAVADGLDVSDSSKLVISLTKLNPFEDDLIKRFPSGCCRWFYMMHFKGRDAALKGKFTFLVSMSGAVAYKVAAP